MLPATKKIDAYFDALPVERRTALRAVRETILANLPAGYQEAFDGRFVTYQVPLEVYPDTYNKQPLMYAALANQGGFMAIYLCNVYGMAPLRKELEAAFRAAGKKLDMGKACLRFKKLDDLPLEVIGRMIAATPLEGYVAFAKKTHSKEARAERSAARGKTTATRAKGSARARPAAAARRARAR